MDHQSRIATKEGPERTVRYETLQVWSTKFMEELADVPLDSIDADYHEGTQQLLANEEGSA